MKPELIFLIVNLTAMASWILLAVAPRWVLTRKIVLSGAISLLLSAVYSILASCFLSRAEGGFGSLAQVMKLFTNEWVALAGWIHYLAFDLFVGAWEIRDAQKRGISHWLVVPCLFLTFSLGPIGFLLYSVLRFFSEKGDNK